MFMPLPASVQTVLRVLSQGGFDAFPVGGCVRDRCMGLEPHDFDVATSATPDEMRQCFAAFRTLDTGLRHGTLTVLIGHEPVEVTTFRVDGAYKDHRRPEQVTFTTALLPDLARRDFTINAMAYDNGQIIDPFGGQADIASRMIRCVGDADTRFDEDALRILRAMRFAATLSFSIEPGTADAMRRQKELLRVISVERIWAEFQKLLCGANAPAVLTAFDDILRVFLPETDEAGLRLLERSSADAAVRLALLLPKPYAQQALERLRVDKKTMRAVTQLHEMQPLPMRKMLSAYSYEQVSRFWLYQCARGERTAEEAGALRREADALLSEKPCLHIGDLAVGGNDLADAGLQGSEIGLALQRLLDGVLEGTLQNDRTSLLRALDTHRP